MNFLSWQQKNNIRISVDFHSQKRGFGRTLLNVIIGLIISDDLFRSQRVWGLSQSHGAGAPERSSAILRPRSAAAPRRGPRPWPLSTPARTPGRTTHPPPRCRPGLGSANQASGPLPKGAGWAPQPASTLVYEPPKRRPQQVKRVEGPFSEGRGPDKQGWWEGSPRNAVHAVPNRHQSRTPSYINRFRWGVDGTGGPEPMMVALRSERPCLLESYEGEGSP